MQVRSPGQSVTACGCGAETLCEVQEAEGAQPFRVGISQCVVPDLGPKLLKAVSSPQEAGIRISEIRGFQTNALRSRLL